MIRCWRPAGSALIALLTIAVVSACGVPVQTTAEPLPSNVLPAPLHIPRPAVSPNAVSSASPIASTASSATTSTDSATATLRLWFVQEDGLAAADSALPSGTTPDLIVQSLAVGPTAAQTADGMRTVARDPLTGLALIAATPLTETPVTPTLPVSAPTTAAPASGPPGPPSIPATPSPPGGPTNADSVTVRLSSAFTALPPTEQVLLLGQVVLSLTGAGQDSVAFADEAGTPVAVPLPDGRLLDVPATARDYNSLIIRP